MLITHIKSIFSRALTFRMFHLSIFSDSFVSSKRFRLSLTLLYKSDFNKANFILLDQSIQLIDFFNFENV